MLNNSESAAAALARERLSSLMDGELAPEQLPELVERWAGDADAQECWHVYHLVGDALRSDDLAVSPHRDQAFLAALRLRLADEPVPLATAPLRPVPGVSTQPESAGSLWTSRRRLIAPVAMAAGVVALVGVLLVLRGGPVGQPESGQMANAAREGVLAVSGSNVIRDTRLDRYLQAHRTQGNGISALAAGGTQFHIVYEPE